MIISLDYLVSRLSDLVPAQSGTPSPLQYENAVRDAVYAFSEKAGHIRIHEFTVSSGTATYDLPGDFISLIELAPAFGGVRINNVSITDAGVIPLSHLGQEELYTINGRTMTFYPTPTYTASRWLRYRASHVPDDDGIYPYLTDQTAGILLAKAQAYAWRVVGARVGRQGWKYTFGDVTIDKSGLGSSINKWAAELETDFDERVRRYVGPQGRLG